MSGGTKRLIVVDEAIPFIHGVLEPYFHVHYLSGTAISPQDIKEAEILLVRTRTKCSQELLQGSAVKCLLSLTTGTDHIDTAWCSQQEIAWEAPIGCNSDSVARYVTVALVKLSLQFHLKRGSILGLIGCGNIGSKVARSAAALGFRVLIDDPPRLERETKASILSSVCQGLSKKTCSLIEVVNRQQIEQKAEVLSLHVPLTYEGKYPTHHLLNRAFVQRLEKAPFIINSSRGEVHHSEALLKGVSRGQLRGLVLDVWENEPLICQDLLAKSLWGTPHIAGYSLDGKAAATKFAVHTLSNKYGLPLSHWEPALPTLPKAFEVENDSLQAIYEVLNKIYDISEDDANLKKTPANFEALRSHYRGVRDFSCFTITSKHPMVRERFAAMGFKVR